MSFASTPLGQGRRLDHHTFLRKTASTSAAVTASSSSQLHATNASQRPHSQRTNISRNLVSYSYGASTASPPRSPPKPERSNTTTEQLEHANEPSNDSDQPALVRFARLKQQEQAQQQAGQGQHVVGPRLINTPPNPSRWAVKDTSVNIASAFHQAASFVIPAYDASTSSHGSNTSTIMNPNDSWASNTQRKPALPRSTSVEYEKEQQQAMTRRLGNPVPRSNISRPPSRISRVPSARHVPEPEAEVEGVKGKTPFEQVIDMSKKLTSIAPTTFFLRRQSEEPEARRTAEAAAPQDQSTSYDYSAEEREFQSSLQDKSNSMDQRGPGGRKRNQRISEDNKAYKPNLSDFEESDEEFEEDGKRTRRKKVRKGASAGTLTSLPVVGYDKRRKGRRGAKENGTAEDGQSDDEVQEISQAAVAAERAARGTTPVVRAPSVSRSTVAPPSRLSVPRSSVPPEPQQSFGHLNGHTDVEVGLHSIPEIDELSIDEADTSAEALSQRSFSVGATLGRGVHWIFSLFSALAGGIWAAIIYFPLLLLRTLVLKPIQKITTANYSPLLRLVPWLVGGLGIYIAWSAASNGYLSGLIPSRSPPPPAYSPPSTNAPADLSEFSDRLLRAESALSVLSIDSARTRTYIEGDARELALLGGKISALESRLLEQSSSHTALESTLRSSISQAIQAVKQEVAVLHAQLEEQTRQAKRQGDAANDKDARAWLKALEQRVGTVEGDIKEAIELGKSAKNDGPIAAVPAWIKDLSAGKTAVTIKSTDGKDVSDLISKLVESAVVKASRDGIGRPDYAMYSSGGGIIPSLTSPTYEIKPDGIAGRVLGMFTGQGNVIGRPPVTILHHENHDGHCWPFAGSQGQVGVMLAFPTRITDVTIDHVSKDMATNLRSAPRHMEVWGLVEGEDNVAKFNAWTAQREESRALAQERGEEVEDIEVPETLRGGAPFMRIANFTYNVHANKEIQTFSVSQDVKDLNMDFGVVVLVVKSNWGREELTCLYRFRVHGEPLGGVPEPLPEDSL